MSLVVARNKQGRIAIASDTRVTEHDQALPPQNGVIKSCMLPGGLCVSFANSPDLAARDLKSFAKKFPQGTNFDDAIGFFERSSADTGNDYILASSPTPRLAKITDGKRAPSMLATEWIGDAEAYDRFRQYESRHRRKAESGRAVSAVLFGDEQEGSPASDLYSAMRHVVTDREISSTGDFVCVVSDRGPHFGHSVYSDMLYNWPEDEGADFRFSYEDRIDFGASGENTEYAVAQIATGVLGLNAVAFYVLRGRKLFVFFGALNGVADRCLALSEVAPYEIRPRLAKALGADLSWLMLVTSSPPAASKTVRRSLTGTRKGTGVGLSFFCHVNTLAAGRSIMVGSREDATDGQMNIFGGAPPSH